MKKPSTSKSSEPATPRRSESIDTATLELLADWARQDATTDPAQIQSAEKEVADFKKAMNLNRAAAGSVDLYP
jgi:hypothetical protein